MARKKTERPEWFKFWRRNRQQLDIDLLSMESRGKIFTNMMRYFDTGDLELVEMTPIETLAFNMVKGNIDESFTEWKERSEKATDSINARWHKQCDDTTVYDGIPPYTEYTEDRGQRAESRIQRTEDRIQNTEDRGQRREAMLAAPALEDVKAFAFEIGAQTNPEVFYSYYAARGWKTGKDAITDWKALFRTWELREAEKDRETGNIFLKILEEEKPMPVYNVHYDVE